MPMQLLRLNEVMYIVGKSCDYIWRKEKTGEFPKRFKIDKTHARWSKEEVEKWMEQREK